MPVKNFAYRLLAQKIAASPVGEKRIDTNIQRKFEVAKEHFIKEFEEHVVTREIEGGIDASNISETLGGYGYLYSFLGLRQSEGDPIPDIVRILEKKTRLAKNSKSISADNQKVQIRLRYSLRTPRAELFGKTKLPWDDGVSWLYSIEKGISGLSRYLSGIFPSPKPSLSGGGVQLKKREVHPGANFKPVKYFNALLRDFVQYFKSL